MLVELPTMDIDADFYSWLLKSTRLHRFFLQGYHGSQAGGADLLNPLRQPGPMPQCGSESAKSPHFELQGRGQSAPPGRETPVSVDRSELEPLQYRARRHQNESPCLKPWQLPLWRQSERQSSPLHSFCCGNSEFPRAGKLAGRTCLHIAPASRQCAKFQSCPRRCQQSWLHGITSACSWCPMFRMPSSSIR